MPIELKMPALSPTMEEGTLAKWLVKEGDTVASGDILAEIETDKATMEFEAVDEGTILKILVPEGSDGVKVGTAIAMIGEEGDDVAAGGSESASAGPAATASAPAPKEEQKARARTACEGWWRNPESRGCSGPCRAEKRQRRSHQGQPAGTPPCRSAGHRSRLAHRKWPRRSHRPRRPGQQGGRRRSGPAGLRAINCGASCAGRSGRYSARSGQAQQHAQDDRAPPDRIEAADPAHLSHGRYPPRPAAQAAQRDQRMARKPRASSCRSTTC